MLKRGFQCFLLFMKSCGAVTATASLHVDENRAVTRLVRLFGVSAVLSSVPGDTFKLCLFI